MTFKFDPERVYMNQRAKYLGQRCFRLKLIVWTHRHSHDRPSALSGLLMWSVKSS